MSKRWRWITWVVVPSAAIILIGFLWKPWVTSADALTREAVEDAVLQLYPGEVAGTKLSKGIYSMLLKTEKGLYDMKVDAQSGEIVSLKRLDAFAETAQAARVEANPSTPTPQIPSSEPSADNTPNQQKPNIDSPPEPTPEHRPPKVPDSKQVPKQDDSKKPANVEVPKDGSLKEPTPTLLTAAEASVIAVKQVKGKVKDTDLRRSKAGAYYLVEIRGGKENKAVVQVNAITGEVMSVTWDDHHGDDGQTGKGRGSDDSGKHNGDDDKE